MLYAPVFVFLPTLFLIQRLSLALCRMIARSDQIKHISYRFKDTGYLYQSRIVSILQYCPEIDGLVL